VGGGGQPKDHGWGRGVRLAIYRTSRNEKVGVSDSLYLSSTTSVHGRPDCNICCFSNVFTRDTVRTFLDGGWGGGVFQNRCWTAVSKKSVFARTSLIDDPLKSAP